MGFTATELEEMARADAEIERTFRITNEEISMGRAMDREAKLERLDLSSRKVAERKRKYREANREKAADYQRQYREANREKVAERQRQYREKKKAMGEPPGVLPMLGKGANE